MTSSKRVRLPLFIFALACGVLFSALALRRGDIGEAVFGLLWMGSFGAVLFFGRGERAELLAEPGDERTQLIKDEAVRHAYSAVILVAVIGFIVEWARGTPGPFTLICFVGGSVHMGSTLFLRNRR